MRFSVSQLKEKFFKERDFIFVDRTFMKRFFKTYYLSSLFTISAMMLFVHEFIMPTPDVQYDLRRLTSPDFDQFILSKGYDAYDPYHRHYIVNYYHSVKQFDKNRNVETIGNFNKFEDPNM